MSFFKDLFCCGGNSTIKHEAALEEVVHHSFGRIPSLKQQGGTRTNLDNAPNNPSTHSPDKAAAIEEINLQQSGDKDKIIGGEVAAKPAQAALQNSTTTPAQPVVVNLFQTSQTQKTPHYAYNSETPMMGSAMVIRNQDAVTTKSTKETNKAETTSNKSPNQATSNNNIMPMPSPRQQMVEKLLSPAVDKQKVKEDEGPVTIKGVLNMKRITRVGDDLKHLTVKNDADEDIPGFMKRSDVRRNSRQMMNETPILRSKKNLSEVASLAAPSKAD